MSSVSRPAIRSRVAGLFGGPLHFLLVVLTLSAVLTVPVARASPTRQGVADDGIEAAVLHAQLVETLQRWDDAYRRGIPAVADSEYDALLERIRVLEGRHPELAAVATDVLGDHRAGTVPHGVPMLSLEKIADRDALRAWHAEMGARLGVAPLLWVEPKLDGVALELVYIEGRLTRALTRGDGRTGEDVTSQIRSVGDVPGVLHTESPPRVLDVRGELVVSRRDLAAFNATHDGPPFPDGRSLAAGSLSLGDEHVLAERPLAFRAHGLGRVEGLEAATHAEAMQRLVEWGLRVVDGRSAPGGADEAWSEHQRLLSQRRELSFETDGSVVKVDDLSSQRVLGSTARAPRWARAIKFPATRASTRVLAIAIGVGRTGALTPRALLEPVSIDGVNVTAATLHGLSHVARLGIKPGDTVLVERAGGVVPQVLAVLQDGGGEPFQPPTRCPRCATPTRGEHCPNRSCPAVLARRLAHFVSPDGLDVNGLGEALAEGLVAAGLVVTLDDVFTLDPATLHGVPHLGARSAERLVRDLAACRDASWERLLVALGIDGIGPATAAALARDVPSWEALLQTDRARLLAVPGIGPALADTLLAWRDDPGERALVERLLARGLGRVKTDTLTDRDAEPER